MLIQSRHLDRGQNQPYRRLKSKPNPEEGSDFNSMKAERGEEAAGEEPEASRGGCRGVRMENVSITSKCQVRPKVLMEKPQQVLQETKQRSFRKVAILTDRLSVCRQSSLLLEGDRLATFLAREKSTPGFEASKDRPTLLLGLMQLVT